MTAYVEHLKPFLRKTPFHERIEPLMTGNQWMRWTGHYSPAAFESVQSEYMAIRNGASVYDVSPLIKYRITGRQAAEYVNHLITRDLAKIKPMQAFYTSWCQDDGMLVEEGTIFRFGENDFLLNAAKDQLHWLEQVAYGFDVHIEDISYDLAGLSLQGPQSRDVLRAFGINGIDHLPRFGILELELNGRWLRIDRAGFTGDLGYEIWTRPQDALWLWDRLFEVGRDHKIAPIGAHALEISRIEAGFILIDADYSGALHALRPSNRMSPYELGIGWTVSLNKQGYFVGKRALKKEKEQGLSRYVLTGIEIEGRKPAPGSFLYADQPGKQELGLTTSAVWSPTLKKNIAYARVPTNYASRAPRCGSRSGTTRSTRSNAPWCAAGPPTACSTTHRASRRSRGGKSIPRYAFAPLPCALPLAFPKPPNLRLRRSISTGPRLGSSLRILRRFLRTTFGAISASVPSPNGMKCASTWASSLAMRCISTGLRRARVSPTSMVIRPGRANRQLCIPLPDRLASTSQFA